MMSVRGTGMGYGGPKILHLFWGRSRPLSWLRLQTTTTFSRLNPEWTIKVWVRDVEPSAPSWPTHEQKHPYKGADYFGNLTKLPNVEVLDAPLALDLPDVQYSDVLRWYLLGTHGGFWSDFDIIYTKPMEEIGNVKGPFLIQYPSKVWPIGFLGAPDDSAKWFFREVEKVARSSFALRKDYQGFGCVALAKTARMHRRVTAQPRMWVYPQHLMDDVKRAFFSSSYEMNGNYIGFHWFAGATFSAMFENAVDPERMAEQHRQTWIIRAIDSVVPV